MSRNDYDPAIEEIEREIRRVRFRESETDRFFGKRARTNAARIAYSKFKETRLRTAYMAGFEQGRNMNPLWYLPAVMGWMLLIIITIQEFTGQ